VNRRAHCVISWGVRGRLSRSVVGAAVASLVLVAAQGSAISAATPQWIVFSASPNGLGVPQLFRVQTTGEGLQQLTTGRLAAIAPSVSPKGDRIVFTRLGSGIFSMKADGTGLRRLTSGRRDSYPVWAPNGVRIAYLRPYRGDWRVHVMAPTGAGQQRLPEAPPAARPTWTADSRGLFFSSGADLIRVDARSGSVLKRYGLALDIVTSTTATVSPGGGKVAYVGPRISTGPEDCGEGPCPQFGLYLANVRAPHRPRRIVNDTGPAGWSPDGKTIVFVSRGALTLRDVAGGRPTAISTEAHVVSGDAPPAWTVR
jgi:Tol biopolymer transport system component